MAANVKVVINREGVRALLRSEGAQAFAKERADRIAAAAAAGSVNGGTFETSVIAGRNRAHASVITADFPAMLDEANDHILTAAIDAAR